MPELLERSAHGHAVHVHDGFSRIGLALADPIRRRVLLRLLDGPGRPSELADEIGTSRSNLSNHLACLRGCGLITAARAGRQVNYQLASARLDDALRSLTEVAAHLAGCDAQQPANSQRLESS